eukprot:CAMPEP_0171298956 /NCGR_PEP_ID=MMETSP0816-20121228/7733_1 /TAXON_ID=420281 /ORGANISM="Proboscia inermis, Strain CCAP1064/1" /LENGTH=82 /DNA_ID=CAMNT_0011774355 /DNA_START=298 /DNA_END=546 /DNA_ORIENTATION=+
MGQPSMGNFLFKRTKDPKSVSNESFDKFETTKTSNNSGSPSNGPDKIKMVERGSPTPFELRICEISRMIGLFSLGMEPWEDV